MRAVQFDRFGGPEVLAVKEVPRPVPGVGEVLLRVEASGVNPKDVMFRQKAPTPWNRGGFPCGTGFDLAGEVVEAGADADLRPGDRVWGFLDGTRGGAAAEYVAVPREWLALRPPVLPAEQAAALPLVASAALQALKDVGQVQPGEHVLIKGAAGGVGRAAVQVARALGAKVTGVVRDGRTTNIAPKDAQRFVTETELLSTREASFDLFIDCVGGTQISPYSRLIRRRGRWVTVAPNSRVYVLTPLSPIIVPLGLPRFGFLMVRPRRPDLELIAGWVAVGALTPPPVAVFPLNDASEAHRTMMQKGKTTRAVLVT